MLTRLVLKFSKASGIRGICVSRSVLEESGVGKDEFVKKWEATNPSSLRAPHFASDWAQTDEDTKTKEQTDQTRSSSTDLPKKLKLNFYMPSQILMEQAEVDMALLPAVTGDFGVMPGHVPTMAQLRPGVISVHKELDKDVKKYFVSGGFAFVHPDSTTDVCVVEAAEIEQFDKEAIKAGLAEYTAKLGSIQAKGDDYEIAAAQIGVDVYSALDAAVA